MLDYLTRQSAAELRLFSTAAPVVLAVDIDVLVYRHERAHDSRHGHDFISRGASIKGDVHDP